MMHFDLLAPFAEFEYFVPHMPVVSHYGPTCVFFFSSSGGMDSFAGSVLAASRSFSFLPEGFFSRFQV
jgi:hypothetical protein